MAAFFSPPHPTCALYLFLAQCLALSRSSFGTMLSLTLFRAVFASAAAEAKINQIEINCRFFSVCVPHSKHRAAALLGRRMLNAIFLQGN